MNPGTREGHHIGNRYHYLSKKCVYLLSFLFFFFRKMLMSAFLVRFKTNYLEKKNAWLPPLFFVIPIVLAKIFFPRFPNLAQESLYLL